MELVPAGLLHALADAGLYGVTAPREVGGLGLDFAGLCAVTEELAGGCLAATFVWIQHAGLLRRLASGDAPAAVRERWLSPAARGELRGGVALAGLQPGPPQLWASPAAGGWSLDGASPWVTGWGLIDVVLVAARGPGDTLVWLIMDAVPQPGLMVSRQRLAAVDASSTVRLDFADVHVPGSRVLSQSPFDPAASLDPMSLRLNGSLALGVAGRCARLIGTPRGGAPGNTPDRAPGNTPERTPGDAPNDGLAASPRDGLGAALHDQVTRCRRRLDDALTDPAREAMADARAAASELAVRATAALTVHTGSRSVMTDQHPQRLAREALFLLVFGSRPGIRATLLRRLSPLPATLT